MSPVKTIHYDYTSEEVYSKQVRFYQGLGYEMLKETITPEKKESSFKNKNVTIIITCK